jgi:uncharacterized membrane protein
VGIVSETLWWWTVAAVVVVVVESVTFGHSFTDCCLLILY